MRPDVSWELVSRGMGASRRDFEAYATETLAVFDGEAESSKVGSGKCYKSLKHRVLLLDDGELVDYPPSISNTC